MPYKGLRRMNYADKKSAKLRKMGIQQAQMQTFHSGSDQLQNKQKVSKQEQSHRQHPV